MEETHKIDFNFRHIISEAIKTFLIFKENGEYQVCTPTVNKFAPWCASIKTEELCEDVAVLPAHLHDMLNPLIVVNLVFFDIKIT